MSTYRPLAPLAARLRSSPRAQRLTVAAALAGYALAATAMLWSGSGVRGAQREAREAAELVRQRQGEVYATLRLLERRVAELRAAREAAVASGVRLDSALEARLDARLAGAGLVPVPAEPAPGPDTLTTAMAVPVSASH